MKVGVDLTNLSPEYSGGVATFSFGLVKGLSKLSSEILVFSTHENYTFLKTQFTNYSVKVVPVNLGRMRPLFFKIFRLIAAVVKNYKLIKFLDSIIPSKVSRDIENSVDVLLAPTVTLLFPAIRIPTILCIHDIQQEFYPQNFSLKIRMARWVSYRVSCWSASLVQASSLYIKDCLLSKFQFMHPDNIFVAFEGVDFQAFKGKSINEDLEATSSFPKGNFLFYPAQLWPHKNHMMLLDSLAIFRDKNGYEIDCVLTGQDYGSLKDVEYKIKTLALSKIHYLGRVSMERMIWLYSNCAAVLALGAHESSSLAVREGALFGKPIICTAIPPNEEVQELLNVWLTSSSNPDQLEEKFERLFIHHSSKIFEWFAMNKEKVTKFNWDEIAKIYFEKMLYLTSKNYD